VERNGEIDTSVPRDIIEWEGGQFGLPRNI